VVIPEVGGPPNAGPDGESFTTSGFESVPLKFTGVESFPFPDLS